MILIQFEVIYLVIFVEYPKCTTCKKAKAWLDSKNISYIDRNIKENNPTADELKDWHIKSGLPLKRFFNTSGVLYKQMSLKDKIPAMTEDEQLEILGQDGMLVKRPIIISDNFVLVGFKENDWETKLCF